MSDKRFKSLDDLCSLLVDERNLACRDRDELKRFLSRTNYYRFSGYAREFQIDPRYGDDRFIGGASFEEIREIAEIDSKMRALLLEQLSVVEIAMRAMLAHEYGRDHGERAFYLNTDFYKDGSDAAKDKPLEIVKGILSDLGRPWSLAMLISLSSGIRSQVAAIGMLRFLFGLPLRPFLSAGSLISFPMLKTRSPPKGRHLSSASNGRPSRRFCIHFAC